MSKSNKKNTELHMLGSFEEHVLLAVLRVDHPYGMAVRREIDRVTGRDVAIGAVYSTLDRLEAKGLAHSRRDDADGRSRRVFSVSEDGHSALAQTQAVRRRLWKGVRLLEVEPS